MQFILQENKKEKKNNLHNFAKPGTTWGGRGGNGGKAASTSTW